MKTPRKIFLALGLCPAFPALAQTNTLVIPAGLDNTFGDGLRAGVFSSPGQWIQDFYSSANFVSLSADQVAITGIAFRVDDQALSSSFDVVIPKVSIWVSTFTGAPFDLSKQVYENWGSDRTLVFSAESAHFAASADLKNPRDFQIQSAFQIPFVYDWTRGHLLFDFVTEPPYSGKNPFGFTDATDSAKGLSVIETPFGPEVVNLSDVLKLSYTAVAEPDPVSLLLVGLVAALGISRLTSSQIRIFDGPKFTVTALAPNKERRSP